MSNDKENQSNLSCKPKLPTAEELKATKKKPKIVQANQAKEFQDLTLNGGESVVSCRKSMSNDKENQSNLSCKPKLPTAEELKAAKKKLKIVQVNQAKEFQDLTLNGGESVVSCQKSMFYDKYDLSNLISELEEIKKSLGESNGKWLGNYIKRLDELNREE